MTRDRAAALDEVVHPYQQADTAIMRALAASGRDRLVETMTVLACCRRVDLRLDAAGLAPMGLGATPPGGRDEAGGRRG